MDSLSDFLETARTALRFPKGSVGVQFVSDSAMASLNLKYRNKKGPTDVLSFPAADEDGPSERGAREATSSLSEDEPYIGDIAIAPETARRNAREYSRSREQYDERVHAEEAAAATTKKKKKKKKTASPGRSLSGRSRGAAAASMGMRSRLTIDERRACGGRICHERSSTRGRSGHGGDGVRLGPGIEGNRERGQHCGECSG